MSESATPEYEEGMICPSCLQRVGSEFVKLHADCMFMVFDVSCLGREEGVHPYERAAMLAYARACAKDRPEVARLIRLRVRLDLRGHSLRAINQKGRTFVTSKSAPEVLSNPNVVCGDVRRFPQAAEGTVACNLLRGHRGQHMRGDYDARGVFVTTQELMWGLTEGERAAHRSWKAAKKADKAKGDVR